VSNACPLEEEESESISESIVDEGLRKKPLERKRKTEMKKISLVLMSVLFAALNLTTSSASAATTGDLVISGEVTAILAMEIYDAADSAPITTYTALTLADGGMSETQIATLHEKCNDSEGYTVNLSAASGVAGGTTLSYLTGATNTGTKIAYTLKYQDVAVVFASGLEELTSTTAINVGFPSFTTKTLKITIVDNNTGGNTGALGANDLAILPSDTYSDTLTFTIASKA